MTLDTEPCAFTVTGESIVRQQGARASGGRLATIRNNEVNSLVPKAKTVQGPGANGITGLGALLVKADTGAVLATVGATCTAAPEPHLVVIEASDADTTASGTATIVVTPNEPPVFGTYPATTVANAGAVTLHPTGKLSDAGHVMMLNCQRSRLHRDLQRQPVDRRAQHRQRRADRRLHGHGGRHRQLRREQHPDLRVDRRRHRRAEDHGRQRCRQRLRRRHDPQLQQPADRQEAMNRIHATTAVDSGATPRNTFARQRPLPSMLSLSLPVHIAVIPEPASWLFVTIGVVVLWRRVRVMKAAVLRGKT